MRIRLSVIAGLAAMMVAAAGGCAAHRELEDRTAPAHAAIPELVTQRCGGCHAVPDPSGMTAEKWMAGLERMKKRIELPAAEWDSLARMAGGVSKP